MQTTENYVRKQYLIAPRQVKKIEGLARKKKVSATEVVRMAIDAFQPDSLLSQEEEELALLVSARLKEALAETKQTRRRLEKTLSQLSGD